jgi:hypothetical protein
MPPVRLHRWGIARHVDGSSIARPTERIGRRERERTKQEKMMRAMTMTTAMEMSTSQPPCRHVTCHPALTFLPGGVVDGMRSHQR